MAKPASRSAKRNGSPIFTGILIGLIVGAILAVAVALWATGFDPFKLGKPATRPAGPAAPARAPTAAQPDAAPSFDFYKVLPGNASSPLPSVATPAAAPQLYLQAGAFQRADEADNMKAQLALLGVEAVIQTTDVPDKGMLHRVRVGPFRSVDEANRTRSLLAQNNIQVTLVKETPTQQEKP